MGRRDHLRSNLTYVPAWTGFLYLAVVLDSFSRRVVGWAMETHWRTELVLAALNMALGQRRPGAAIHHSDHGTQYTSIAFGPRCREAGVRRSMGSSGDCFDNAMRASFLATLECELLERRSFKTQVAARMAIFDFIEGWYNPHRRHSALGYQSPLDYARGAPDRGNQAARTVGPARAPLGRRKPRRPARRTTRRPRIQNPSAFRPHPRTAWRVRPKS